MLYEISEIERQMIADALDIISPDNDEARRTLESLLGTFQLEQPTHACPNCGDASHIYAKGDIRFFPESGTWEVTDVEDSLDCTECDHAWSLAESGLPQP